jgi:hypothetical protein
MVLVCVVVLMLISGQIFVTRRSARRRLEHALRGLAHFEHEIEAEDQDL